MRTFGCALKRNRQYRSPADAWRTVNLAEQHPQPSRRLDIAARAGNLAAELSGPTIRNFENSTITPRRAAIQRALEDAGVGFTIG